MKRRTFFGMVAGWLGLPQCTKPVRPLRSKPFIEMGRPEYEEPPLMDANGGYLVPEELQAMLEREFGLRT